MSRVANSPIELPKGVEVTLSEAEISIKGSKGTLAMPINAKVSGTLSLAGVLRKC